MNRYEIKYLITPDQRAVIEAQVKARTRPDPHGADGTGRYPVYTLYFDSPDLGSYHEKMAGIFQRSKLRMRHYNERHDPLVLEIKGRISNQIIKDRLRLNRARADAVLRGVRLHEDEWHPVVQKYNRWTSQREVRPNLQISYVRQAYIAPLQANLRITFDSRVSVRRATRFGQVTGLPYLVLHPQWTVLEIKFERLMPEWVDELVHRHGLTNQSVSKYCLGVDRLAMLRQLCGAA